MKVKIEVTQEHINKGQKYNSFACPIKYALQDAIAKLTIRVAAPITSVSLTDCYIGNRDVVHNAKMPKAAKQFVHDFDHGEPVKPFTFTVYFKGIKCEKAK